MNDGQDAQAGFFDPVDGDIWQARYRQFTGPVGAPGAAQFRKCFKVLYALQNPRDNPVGGMRIIFRYT